MKTEIPPNISLQILEDGDQVARSAADWLVARLRDNPRSSLGLATGRTVRGLYKRLAEMYNQGELSLSHCKGLLLDEYVGLPPGHPQNMREVINRQLIQPTDLAAENVFSPWCDPGTPETWERVCREYDSLVFGQRGLIQILGIGRNGHLGFNEPGSSFGSNTRVVELTEQTRADNAWDFSSPEEVPRQAVTQGLSNLFSAEWWLLLAIGEAKANTIARALTGRVDRKVPASLIQYRFQAMVFLDQAAASGLS